MNKELEEAKGWLSALDIKSEYGATNKELILQAIENSISREVIEKKLTELKKEYKEALETNSIKAFILKCQIEILGEIMKGE